MGYLFVDDSVHERGGFVLGGVVYSDVDPTDRIARALRDADLTPGVDEFKSRHRMDESSAMQLVRQSFNGIIRAQCWIGVIVVPFGDHRHFGNHVLTGVQQIISSNVLPKGQLIYLDEGLFSSFQRAQSAISATSLNSGHRVVAEADSRSVLGLQVADFVAHTCSTMLLEQLGVVTKTVKAGEHSGYDPDLDLELGFALWADLRYSFFRRPRLGTGSEDPLLDAECGLHIANNAGSGLRQAALDRFGTAWLGCIH